MFQDRGLLILSVGLCLVCLVLVYAVGLPLLAVAQFAVIFLLVIGGVWLLGLVPD